MVKIATCTPSSKTTSRTSAICPLPFFPSATMQAEVTATAFCSVTEVFLILVPWLQSLSVFTQFCGWFLKFLWIWLYLFTAHKPSEVPTVYKIKSNHFLAPTGFPKASCTRPHAWAVWYPWCPSLLPLGSSPFTGSSMSPFWRLFTSASVLTCVPLHLPFLPQLLHWPPPDRESLEGSSSFLSVLNPRPLHMLGIELMLVEWISWQQRSNSRPREPRST